MIYGHTGGYESLPKIQLSTFDKRRSLEKKGFVFYRSLKAGKNSTYSFKQKNRECSIGFDSISEAVDHAYMQIELGKDPFMIF